MAGKIRTYRIEREVRKTGIQLQVPIDWIRDMDLQTGDAINIFRDEKNRIVLVANKKKVPVLAK